MKTVPISLRIAQEDAEFLASLKGQGTTLSEKVRALIGEAKIRRDQGSEFSQCHSALRELIAPAVQRAREADGGRAGYSELVSRLGEWLPDTVAFYATSLAAEQDRISKKDLEEWERGLALRVFQLIESVLRLGVTAESPTYDRTVIQQRLGPVLALTKVINEVNASGGTK